MPLKFGHQCSRTKPLPVVARVSAFIASVLSSFCWQVQNWTPTKQQYSSISSWFARLGSAMVGVRRCPEEPMDSRRRLHRDGKRCVDVISAVKAAKFRFAGHIARLPGTENIHRVLKVRHLAWWRAQKRPRFTQTEDRDHTTADSTLCTDGRTSGSLQRASHRIPTRNSGFWMQTAQDREGWKAAEVRYLVSWPPCSTTITTP